ncbi:AbrB family transcriptional regulator [Pseudomonas sp. B21-041]|uniref:AbrB family transcriptional regulator n=1 Tax=Pseudomonas TaxID=286 RepID=UPI000BA45551|nr:MULTISPECIES: AbrB family transcriptional regulator [Pseudomonas]UVL32590.1 AbrB family transcriptional regulator [Pseudomonas sp. B21-041]WPN72471.1 AbrB family transcriptional regulator [Pseudomonas germanica]
MKSILCLLMAAGFGALLQFEGVPHGLLLGSIVVTALFASKTGIAPATPYGLGYIQVTLGIATGLMFEAWDSETASTMLPSLGVLLICLAVQIALAGWWLTRGAGWNRTDALLAVYPGALAAVFDLLESEKASSKVIIVHLMRLLLITVLVSFLIPGQAAAVAVADGDPLTTGMALTAFSVIALSVLLGRLLLVIGVPAPFMLTAIIITAVFVKSGWLHGFHMPDWSLNLAALILGVRIGSRFQGLGFAELTRHGRTALVSVGLMIVVAAVFAEVAARWLGSDPLSLWLAYMPGAIETIAIVAFGGGLNVVFILTHHLSRMVLLHFAPALLVQVRRAREEA